MAPRLFAHWVRELARLGSVRWARGLTASVSVGYLILVFAFSAFASEAARALVERSVELLSWCAALALWSLSGASPRESDAGWGALRRQALESTLPLSPLLAFLTQLAAQCWVLFRTLALPATVLTIGLALSEGDVGRPGSAAVLVVGVLGYCAVWALTLGFLSFLVRTLLPRQGGLMLLALLVVPSCTSGSLNLPNVPERLEHWLSRCTNVALSSELQRE